MQSVFSTTDNSGEFSDFEIKVDQDKVMWGKVKGDDKMEPSAWIADVTLISSAEETDDEDVQIGLQDQKLIKVTEENELVLNLPGNGIDLTAIDLVDISTRLTENEKCESIKFNDWIIRIGEKESINEPVIWENRVSVAEVTTPTAILETKSPEKGTTSGLKTSPKYNMTTRLRSKMHHSNEKDGLAKNNMHLSNLLPSATDSTRSVQATEATSNATSNANVKAHCTTHIRLQKTSNKLRRMPFLQPVASLNQPSNEKSEVASVKREKDHCQESKVNSDSINSRVSTYELSNSASVIDKGLGLDLPNGPKSDLTVIKEGPGLPLNSITSTTVIDQINDTDMGLQNMKKRRRMDMWKKGRLPKPKVSYKSSPKKLKVSIPNTTIDSSQQNSRASFPSESTLCDITMPCGSFYPLAKRVSETKLSGVYSLTTVTSATINASEPPHSELVKAESKSPISKSSPNKHKLTREVKNLVLTNESKRPRRQLKISPNYSPKASPQEKEPKSSTENIVKRKDFKSILDYFKEVETVTVALAKTPKHALGGTSKPTTGTPQESQKSSPKSEKFQVAKKSPLVPKLVLKKSMIKDPKAKKVAQMDEKLTKKKKEKAVKPKTVKSKDKVSNLVTQKKKAIRIQLTLNKKKRQNTTDATTNKETMAVKKTKKLADHKKTTKSKNSLLQKPSKNKTVKVTSQTTLNSNASSQKATMTSDSGHPPLNTKSHDTGSTVPQISSELNLLTGTNISQSQLQLQHLAATFPLSPSSISYLCSFQASSQSTTALPNKKTATKTQSQGGHRVGRPRKDVSSSVQSARMTLERSMTGSSTNQSPLENYSCLASEVVAASCLPRVVLPQLPLPGSNGKRSSVRQTECAFRYREIIIKKMDNFIQIVLASNTRVKNGLNCQVMYELRMALTAAKADSKCHLVVVHGTGSVFCSGVDLISLSMDRGQTTAAKMSSAVRDFCKVLLSFPKPLIAAVNGAAVGLGVTFLPMFDLVYASDKATFYTPYCKLGQIPEGGATLTLPSIMGYAKANGLLLEGRRLTATEAHDSGLVSQVLWPASFMEEVIPRVQALAKRPLQAMESTKALVRYHAHSKLEVTLDTECRILLQQWSSDECRSAIRDFLQFEEVV